MGRTIGPHFRAVPPAALGDVLVDRMWRMYAEHYDHVHRHEFERDLAEKTVVFIGIDRGTGELAGFSTALFYFQRHQGRRVGIYFSGDTILRPRYWGTRALHRCVLSYLVAWHLQHPFTPLYWHLICSGWRTYLTLARNFPDHWPALERPTPAFEAGLLQSICRARFPDAWDERRGVVSFGPVQPVLKEAVAPLTQEVLALPEVRFFIAANPGWARGDELAMLARVNGRAVGWMVGRWLRQAVRHTPTPRPVAAREPRVSEAAT
jgi:hypothetical protein